MWKNNIEEIPRDPFQILQQNEALASRQLNSGDPLSPRSAILSEKESRCNPSKSFSSGQNYPDANRVAQNVMSELMVNDIPDPVELKEESIKRLLVDARNRRLESWYHSKSFPPYPVSSYDLDGGYSMAFRLKMSLYHCK